mmetsp:Transcript_24729/g.36258  ORF Transcript_24729/g.36258 Transcript_24729/m.36258 type:complete len:187 (-) Transcript_24729:117-677(-)|eukprot:CAMPEP_0195517652 /NCGR_PEP_ID=MMETSP0794_2-20130614/11188_1 /TAXON_ID=515487 /ORGANISM="Stephanopyxis turris, Strain CCMP 815" /LENGTH=186 /DNA_ID=CAMNT_0040646489 /DNA_START=111 /DNA_END=671 /DNA_ORIENTATION=+
MWAQVAKQSPPLSAERKLQICQSCVGHRVDLKLKSQQKDGPAETVQGIVYAAHGSLVILQEAGGIRLVNVKYLAAPPTKLEKVITELDSGQSFDAGAQQALIEKFEVAKAKRERVLANRNPDAPALAQKIFDFLSKTYTPSWEGTTIVIKELGDVRVPEPYTVDVVTGTQPRAVDRVKTVVAQFNQ